MVRKQVDPDEPQILCKLTPSAWKANTQVPTYFVAAKGRKGYFTTLNDAINFAEPYSRIEVTSGKYMENVIVNKPIEIGTNTNEEVSAEIYSRGVTFTFQTSEAHIEGLRIRTAAATTALNENKTAGIKIETGSPSIVRCDVDSILVAGDATPNIEDNKIHGSKLHGLYLQDSAGGFYRANTIENHPGYGIVVVSTGGARFSHNKVTFCEQGQVQVNGGTNGVVNPTFTFNNIRDEIPDKEQKQVYSGANALAKLKELPVRKTGDPVQLLPDVVPRSRITDLDSDENDRKDDSSATDVRAGFVVRSGAHPIVSQNTFTASCSNGILICSGGLGEYSQNKIAANKGFGICVEDDGSEPLIRENSIGDNGAGGIRVRNGGGGTVKRNEFKDNRGPQIMIIRPCDHLRITRNEFVSSGPRVGILCRDRATAKIEHNLFRDCYIGVRVESHANPSVHRNIFQTCYIGAACVRWGKGLFEENEFANNRQACVAVTTMAHPTFFRCRMVASEHGVIVQQGGRGLFDGNHIKDNNSTQVVVKLRGNPTFINNMFKDGREVGLLVCDDGRGTYMHNFFEENCIAQVEVRNKADPIFEKNLVRRGNGDGMLLTDTPYGTFVGNVFEGNHGAGVKVEQGGRPTIRANMIHNNRGPGLHIAEEGEGVFEKNEIAGNGTANVLVTGTMIQTTTTTASASAAGQSSSPRAPGSPAGINKAMSSILLPPAAPDESLLTMPVVRRNWISYCGTVGITASSRGRCAIIQNVIAFNGQAAVRVTAGSTLFVTGNEFEGGEGVVIADDGQCFLMGNTFKGVTGAAVTLLTGAKPVMAWNTIVGCNVGVNGEGGAGAVFENIISKCKIGIETKHFSRTVFGGNVITDCDVGCALSARSKGHVTCNVFRENGTGVTCDGDLIAAHFDRNTVIAQREAGVRIRSGAATFTHNVFLNNPTNILVEGHVPASGMPKISHNVIAGGVGIAAANRGKAKFEDNHITACRIGISCTTHSSVLMVNSFVTHNDIGAMFLREGNGDFESCRFANNLRNVVVTMRSAPQFLRCSITDAKFFNLTYSGGASGRLNECVISKSRIGGGIHIEREAAPRVEQCRILQHDGVPTGGRDIAARASKQHGARQPASVHTSGGSRRQSVHSTVHRRQSAFHAAVPHKDGGAAGLQITLPPSMGSGDYANDNEDGDAHSPDAPPNEAALLVDFSSNSDSDHDYVGDAESVAKQKAERKKKRAEARMLLEPKDRGIFKGHGVVVELSGGGTFIGCTITMNAVAFVGRTGSSCVLDGCTILENATYGLLFEAGSKGGAVRCCVSKNKLSQIVVTGSGSSPLIEDSVVRDSVSNGFQIDLSASPTLRSNTVYNINGSGIACLEGGAPTAEDNLFFDCAEGIAVRNRGAGSYSGNRITRTRSHGISIDGDCTSPIFTGGEISACGASGAFVSNGASPEIHECVIHSSVANGIEVGERCAPLVSRCYIFHNSGFGVLFAQEAGGQMDGATIFTNTLGAISVRNKSNPSIEGCIVYGGETDGIVIQNASPVISKTRVHYVGGCGIVIDGPGSSPTIHSNEVMTCEHSGIRATRASKGRIHFNACFNNRTAGILVESEANPNIKGNFVKQNGLAGLWCLSNAWPRVEENIFCSTARGSGVVVEALARPALHRNLFAHNSQFGIHYRDGGRGSCSECISTKNNSANFCVETKATPTISECCVFDGDCFGIVVRDGGMGMINGCHVTGALQAGIVVDEGASPQLDGNVVRELKLGVIDGGDSRHENMYVAFCSLGVEIRGGAPEFLNCDWRECNAGAAFTGGRGTISTSSFWGCTKATAMGENAFGILSKSKFFHCREAVACEGSGEVNGCELTFNTNGIIVYRGSVMICGNTVFDCTQHGIHIRDGDPTIQSNLVFDNLLSCVTVDGGSPFIDDNKLFYPKDGGTIVNNRPETARIGKNTEHNKYQMKWDKNEVDRRRDYDKLIKPDYEKHTPRFKKCMRMYETVSLQVLGACRDHLKRIENIAAESSARTLPLVQLMDFDNVEMQSSPVNSIITRAYQDAESILPNRVGNPTVVRSAAFMPTPASLSASVHSSPNAFRPDYSVMLAKFATNPDAVPIRHIPFIMSAFGSGMGPLLTSPGSPEAPTANKVSFADRRASSIGGSLELDGGSGKAASSTLTPGECPVLDDILARVDAHLATGGIVRDVKTAAAGAGGGGGGTSATSGGGTSMARLKSVVAIAGGGGGALSSGERKESQSAIATTSAPRRKTLVPKPPGEGPSAGGEGGSRRQSTRNVKVS